MHTQKAGLQGLIERARSFVSPSWTPDDLCWCCYFVSLGVFPLCSGHLLATGVEVTSVAGSLVEVSPVVYYLRKFGRFVEERANRLPHANI